MELDFDFIIKYSNLIYRKKSKFNAKKFKIQKNKSSAEKDFLIDFN